MFDIKNKDYIKDCINKRIEGGYVIPIYVSLYKETYLLTELDQITEYSPGSIKVGFGACSSPLEKKPFPSNRLNEVDVIDVIFDHDESSNIDIRYVLFETSGLDGDDPVSEQVNYYVDIIDERVKDIVKEYKKKVAAEFNDNYFN